MNGNLYIDFMNLFSSFVLFILFLYVPLCLLCFSAVINISSSFSAEGTENGESAAPQVLARVAVRVRMCVPIGKNNVRVACFCACARPRNAE